MPKHSLYQTLNNSVVLTTSGSNQSKVRTCHRIYSFMYVNCQPPTDSRHLTTANWQLSSDNRQLSCHLITANWQLTSDNRQLTLSFDNRQLTVDIWQPPTDSFHLTTKSERIASSRENCDTTGTRRSHMDIQRGTFRQYISADQSCTKPYGWSAV